MSSQGMYGATGNDWLSVVKASNRSSLEKDIYLTIFCSTWIKRLTSHIGVSLPFSFFFYLAQYCIIVWVRLAVNPIMPNLLLLLNSQLRIINKIDQ